MTRETGESEGEDGGGKGGGWVLSRGGGERGGVWEFAGEGAQERRKERRKEEGRKEEERKTRDRERGEEREEERKGHCFCVLFDFFLIPSPSSALPCPVLSGLVWSGLVGSGLPALHLWQSSRGGGAHHIRNLTQTHTHTHCHAAAPFRAVSRLIFSFRLAALRCHAMPCHAAQDAGGQSVSPSVSPSVRQPASVFQAALSDDLRPRP